MSSYGDCAGCGIELDYEKVVCDSGIYFPNAPRFHLCEPCWISEEIEIERQGTNDLPEFRKLYAIRLGRSDLAQEAT